MEMDTIDVAPNMNASRTYSLQIIHTTKTPLGTADKNDPQTTHKVKI